MYVYLIILYISENVFLENAVNLQILFLIQILQIQVLFHCNYFQIIFILIHENEEII